jgi:hypothetical protein
MVSKSFSYLEGLLTLLLSIFFSILLIILYKISKCYFYPNTTDPLLRNIYKSIDGWTLSHFFYFAYITYIFPTYIYELILLGILWELFEELFGLLGLIYKDQKYKWIKDCLEDYNHPGRWWYGKKEDILSNMLGILYGLLLRYFI